MRRFYAALLTLALVSGCYVAETIETRIVFRDGDEPPQVFINYNNISSTGENEDEIRSDFEELLRDWQSDQFLIERSEEGLLIKSRRLYVNDGKIMAELACVSTDLDQLYSFFVGHNERILFLKDEGTYEIAETNGKILRTENNTLIVWPDSEKELYWKLQVIDPPRVFFDNISRMVQLFTAAHGNKVP